MTAKAASPNRWMIAIAAIAATSLEAIDAFILNVSLDNVRGSLSAAVDEVVWVLTSYLVASTIVLPFIGWLSDRFGQKRLFMWSVLIFTGSSLLAGAAPNLETLVLARIIQGLGGGCLVPLSQAFMLQNFPGRERGMAMAIWGIGIKFGPICAPVLGGWITDNWGWRWIFYINLPLGTAAMLLASRYLPSDREHKRISRPLDVYGAFLLILGIAALQLFLELGHREDWFESTAIVQLGLIAVATLVLFIVHVLRHPHPIVHLRIFTNPIFAIGTLILFCVTMGQHSFLVLSPMFTKSILDYTAFLAGLVLAPGGFAHLLIMPVTGALLGRIDARWFIATGCVFVGLSMYGMATLNAEASFVQVLLPRFVQGIGFGLTFVALTTVTISSVPSAETTHAAGLFNLMRHLGGSLGIAFVRTSLERDTQTFQSDLVSHVTMGEPRVQLYLEALVAKFMALGADAAMAQQQAVKFLYELVRKQALLKAFLDNFYMLTWLFFVLAPLVLLLRERRR
ncbi:DHA2 family efflux MFS transporter permease subunit [Haliangium sp.]|uniref:DHA2 family efflux MFS transporter permease subunit n=1 Tax=Haliangium sp. TaxID=2663208 RepID=UPI003D0AEF52